MIRRTTIAPFITALFLAVLAGCGGGGGSNPGGGGGTPPLSIATITLPNGVSGQAYNTQLTASGGVAPYTWSLSSGSVLPSGLTLSASGVLSGTSSSSTVTNISVSVQDSSSPRQTATISLTLNIDPPLVISTSTLANANLSVPYNGIVVATGVAVKSWTITSGQLPAGLALVSPSSFTVGIQGTPTQKGSATFTLEAHSTTTPEQVASKTLTLQVDDNPVIVTSQLLDVVRNRPYQDSLNAANGIPPYHWSIQSGTLPAGIALDADTGILSGTFTTGTAFSNFITFQVTDSSSPVRSATRGIILNVLEPLAVNTSIPSGRLNQSYFGFVNANGGKYPFTWSLTSGSLPPGLTLSQTGFISGVPTQLGDFTLSLHVQDSTNPPQTADGTVTLSILPPLLTTSNSLPSRIPLNVPFSGFAAAQGGTPPYTWQLSGGSLPTGLQLNSTTGEVSGTPTVIGTYNFAIQVTDHGSTPQNATQQFSMTVAAPLGRNDSIQKATPIGNGSYFASISPYADPVDVANPDVDYYKIIVNNGTSVQLNTIAKQTNSQNPLDTVIELVDVNGVRLNTCNPPSTPSGPFTSSCLDDDIQPGIIQDSVLYYLPSGPAGSQSVIYAKVFDWRGDARPDMTYTLNVSGAVSQITFNQQAFPSSWPAGSAFNQTLSASGGTGAYSWSVTSGTLPPGIALSTSGLLSGTPTTAGTYTFTITVTDQGSPPQTASKQFTIQIL